jgi:two-component system nitrate/nitrite response regulator NarL
MSSVTERSFDDGRAGELSELRVAILVSSEIVRQGLAAMLNTLAMVKEVEIWTWGSIARISSITPGTGPDILILGFDVSAVEAIDNVAQEAALRGTKVLLLLDQAEEALLDMIATIPSDGFIAQQELDSESLAAILADVADGDTAVPAMMAQRLLARARAGALGPPSMSPSLTPRERQVLELLVAGLSNKQIARRLGISPHGVKRLVSNVLAKLGCPNRTLAVAMAITERILADQW